MTVVGLTTIPIKEGSMDAVARRFEETMRQFSDVLVGRRS